MTRAAILALLLALAVPAGAGAATTPKQAAAREAACLRAHGWKASAHGVKVAATGRRTRTADSLRHPWYRAEWISFGVGAPKPVEAFAGVNDREHTVIAHCRSKAQR